MNRLSDAAAFLRDGDGFLLISHVSPDGDTLGSALALYQGLLKLGKRVFLACEEPVPVTYRELPFADRVRAVPEEGFSCVVCIDCADLRRCGTLEPLVKAAARTLCIDHHATNAGFADVNYVEDCAATGEIVFSLLSLLGVPLTQDIAVCLYTALATDTGNFSYSNTTPQTFRIMAELLAAGIDLPRWNRILFRSHRAERMRVLGLMLPRMELLADGRFGISYLTYGELTAYGATSADCEGLIDYIRDIDTVEVACFARESQNGQIRVSMRSKESFDVAAVAQLFQGGGHVRAAGCTLSTDMQTALDRLKAEILLRL